MVIGGQQVRAGGTRSVKGAGRLAEAGQWLRRTATAPTSGSPSAGPDRDAVTRWISGATRTGATGVTSDTRDTGEDDPRSPDEGG